MTSLDQLSELWCYASRSDHITIRRPLGNLNTMVYTLEDSDYSFPIQRLFSWERQELVEVDRRLVGDEQVVELALTPKGRKALYGDA